MTSYGTTPNDQNDDTQGFQSALEATINKGMGSHCYIPPGTYYVSNTIGGNSQTSVWWRFFTMRGAGPDKTVIRLKANSAGFNDRTKPKPVFHFLFSNNATHAVFVEHLTIEVESGNPGATALMFGAHNGGGVTNVVLRAADNSGFIGLDKSETPGPEMVKDLSVYGFEKGVFLAGGMYSVTFLNLHVEGQRVYGVHNNGVPTQIHNFTSTNTVRAIHSGGNGLVLINATCSGGAAGEYAVAGIGPVYLRNFSCKGSAYSTALADAYSGKNQTGPDIADYSSETIKMTFNSTARGLGLDIKNPPDPAWDPPASWTSVSSAGGFQAAVNAGKSTIFFPAGSAAASSEVHVNNSAVKRIVSFGSVASGKVVFDNTDPNSVVVADHLDFGGGVEVKSAGKVILKSFDGNVTISGSGETYLEDYCCGTITITGAKVWGWQINTESITSETGVRITNNGGQLVMIGVKTEGNDAVLSNKSGAKTELLGGFIYPVGNDLPSPNPAFINDNSDLALFHNRLAWDYACYIREIRDGSSQDVSPQFGTSCAYVTNPSGAAVSTVRVDRSPGGTPGIRSERSAIVVATPALQQHDVSVFSMQGRCVFAQRGTGGREYRIPGAPEGLYIARITTGSGRVSAAVVCRE